MKKLVNILSSLVLAFCALSAFSCANAIVDDGTNVRSYVNSSGGGGNSGSGGGAIPFKTYNDVFDIQIWSNSFTATTNSECLTITVGSVGWWGGAFVASGSVQPTDSSVVTYDMSLVKKISFDAMASVAGKFVAYGGSDSSAATHDPFEVSVTTEWQNFEFDVSSGSSKDYSLFCLGGATDPEATQSLGGSWASGSTISIKNIAFYDSTGNEIVPTVNK